MYSRLVFFCFSIYIRLTSLKSPDRQWIRPEQGSVRERQGWKRTRSRMCGSEEESGAGSWWMSFGQSLVGRIGRSSKHPKQSAKSEEIDLKEHTLVWGWIK
jgi:hypothetical protein